MKHFMLLICMFAMVIAVGCSGNEAENAADSAMKKVEDATEDAGSTALAAVNAALAKGAVDAELACGGCIYKMDGVQGCKPAAKVAGKTFLLSGVPVDTHALGLCEAPKQAVMEAKLEDGKLVASKVDVK